MVLDFKHILYYVENQFLISIPIVLDVFRLLYNIELSAISA
jgi:hypothetical protein